MKLSFAALILSLVVASAVVVTTTDARVIDKLRAEQHLEQSVSESPQESPNENSDSPNSGFPISSPTAISETPQESPNEISESPNSEMPISYPTAISETPQESPNEISESPNSEFPISYPTTTCRQYPDDMHCSIEATLEDTFQSGTCSRRPIDNGGKELFCKGEAPGVYSSVLYIAKRGAYSLCPFEPEELTIIYTTDVASSLSQIDFVDECMADVASFLKLIKERLDVRTLPPSYQCSNSVEEFALNNQGTKVTTCAEVANLITKKRNKICSKQVAIDQCPGICDVENCNCEDYLESFKISRKKSITCAEVQTNIKKREKRCKNRRISALCRETCSCSLLTRK